MKKHFLFLLVAFLVSCMPRPASANRLFVVKGVKLDEAHNSFDLRVKSKEVENYVISRNYSLVILQKDYLPGKSLVTFNFGSGIDLFGNDLFVMSVRDLNRMDMTMSSINLKTYLTQERQKRK